MSVVAVDPHGSPIMGVGSLAFVGLGLQKVYKAWTTPTGVNDSHKFLSDRVTSIGFLVGSGAMTITWVLGRMGRELVFARMPILKVIEAVFFASYYVTDFDDASHQMTQLPAMRRISNVFYGTEQQKVIRRLIAGLAWSVFYAISMTTLVVSSPALVASANLAATVGLAIFVVDLFEMSLEYCGIQKKA